MMACHKSKPVAADDPAASIIQGLEASVVWTQLDALEAVKQTTDSELLARLKSKVDALAVSSSAQPLVISKAGTVLFQKYGQVDPRHAEAYTHLLMDDPSMADALRKAAMIDPRVTLQAIEAKETKILEILPTITGASDQASGKRLLEELAALKAEIRKPGP